MISLLGYCGQIGNHTTLDKPSFILFGEDSCLPTETIVLPSYPLNQFNFYTMMRTLSFHSSAKELAAKHSSKALQETI